MKTAMKEKVLSPLDSEIAQYLLPLTQTNNSLMPADSNSQATCSTSNVGHSIVGDYGTIKGNIKVVNSTEILLSYLELLKSKDALIEKLLLKGGMI